MNHGALIFLGLLASFVASWWALIFAPHMQVGTQKSAEVDGFPFPRGLPGIAAQGREVFVAQGCVQCHSQQVQQDGFTFDVVITGAGTNAANVSKVIASVAPDANANELLAKASESSPQPVLKNVTQSVAEDAQAKLKKAGAPSQVVFIPLGADIARRWGARRSVARDYLHDYPVQTGNSRLGPDLANIGTRMPDANWHLMHLYHPRTVVKGSIMPAYKYLFDVRPVGKEPSPSALVVPEEFAPKKGYEIVPKREALQLVAYLQSLHVDTPLFEAPATQLAPPPAPAGTNAPGATNAPATNPPAK